MDGVVLEENQEKSELLLGIHIDSNLKWHSQVRALIGKLKSRLFALEKLKFIAPYQTKKMMTVGIFNSVLVYCLPLFGGCDKGEVKDLQVIQNKAAQIVTKKPPRTNINELYNRLGWMTVAQLIE